jgi:S1-C subfamily serine protease
MKRMMALISVLALFALACSVGLPNGISNAPLALVPTLSSGGAPAAILSNEAPLAEIFNRVNPGVVAIRAYSGQSGTLGSGFFVDSNGHLITNRHVVTGAEELEVDFPDGKLVRGTIVAEDPDTDLAVVKVDLPAEELHPLVLGDSSALRVGDLVVAIGNPFGLDSTMTLGIVSAKGRTLDSEREAPGARGILLAAADLIQTDAAVNMGNSGGPLLNMKGEVVGMNRAIISSASSGDTALNSGVGFAISSNVIRRVLPSLVANGKYDYPYLGITALPQLLLIIQEDLGLPYGYGVYVTDVNPSGPAGLAGIQGAKGKAGTTGIPSGGDLILKLNGETVRNFSELNSYLFYHTVPGDTLNVTVYRDGKQVDVPVTVGKRS